MGQKNKKDIYKMATPPDDVSEILTGTFEYFMISKKKDLNRKCVRILIRHTVERSTCCHIFLYYWEGHYFMG